MPSVDLSQLPPPAVVETIDFEALFAARKAKMIAAAPEEIRVAIAATLELDSEPLTMLLQENAYAEIILRQRINEAAKAVTLAYAMGDDLDVVAANLDTARKIIRPADPSATPPAPEIKESDSEYRDRAQRAFEGLSVAGPRGAYEFHALSADARVADARAVSPAPCEVTVAVLSREGDGTAQQDLIDRVRAALNGEDVRPVADRLTVQGAVIVPYQVEATLYIYPGPEAEPIRAAAQASLETYIGEQRRLGRDIRRSALFAAIHVAGVQRVEIAKPATDLVLAEQEAGHCTCATLHVGGSDE